MIATLLALVAAAPTAATRVAPVAVRSGPDRILPLVQTSGGTGAGCTRDRRYCIQLIAGEQGPLPALRSGRMAQELQTKAGDDESTVWPILFALGNGGFLAGVQHKVTTGYSGGGGSASTLQLYEISRAGRTGIRPVMEAPLEASLMIRACFSEQDMAKRHGACHDEYDFSARIGLAPGRSAGMPILTYTTQAWSFPRGVARSTDSTRMRALRRTDLVRQRDPKCSFTRTLRFNQESGLFRPETPMPDCSDYTTP